MEVNKGGYPVKNAGYWKRQHDKLQAENTALKRKLTAVKEWVDTLSDGGCLDSGREKIV